MLNGYSTTYQWQDNPTDICILPVGSFEQHSSHLPLNTDTVTAEYFSREIAKNLKAALLPPINFGTSQEHTGFRGTVSLAPETLITVVRNIAAALKPQGFKFLILINGHGGNHVLTSIVRDINSRNYSIKLLLINIWDFSILFWDRNGDKS
jgi:creatinine amidohydrolase